MTPDSWVVVLLPALVPIGLLTILLLLKHPEWAPSSILLTATLSPWSFSRGLTPVLILTALSSALCLVAYVFRRSRQVPKASSTRRAAVAFAMTACVSALWGWLAMEPAVAAFWTPQFFLVQLGQLAALVLGPAALLLTSVVLTTRRLLKSAIVGYLVLTTIGLVLSLLMPALEVNLRGLVLTWSACIIYGQLLFNAAIDRRLKVAMAGVLALTLYVKFVLAFTWVSGWLPALVAITVITAFKSSKAVAGFTVAAVIVVMITAAGLQQDYAREYDESGSTRMAKWSLVMSQPFARDHLLIGTGPANYALYFTAYTPRDRLSTHNNYIDIFLQMGVIGLMLTLWLLLSAGRLALRLSLSKIRDPFLDGFVRSSVGGIAAVLVSMMLGDWFTPFVYNQTLAGFSWTVQSWVFIGALCAVPMMLQRQASHAHPFPTTDFTGR